jgi:hypothetical protein
LKWRNNRSQNVQFKECELDGCEFVGGDGATSFHSCDFKNSTLVKYSPDLESCAIIGCTFKGCDFSAQRILGVRFENCLFIDCSFNYLRIHGAVFDCAKFEGTTKIDFAEESGEHISKRRNVPEFYGVTGLEKGVVDSLNRVGAIWKEVRQKDVPRKVESTDKAV